MSRQVKDTSARVNSDLVACLPEARVRAELSAAQNKFITVEFIKNNGELRRYNGQLRAASRLVGNERGQAQGEAMKARGQVWLALPNGQSKSFYMDRVTALKVGGVEITAG
ncbi:hypothetical protein RPALISO_230 [Ruegeria phage RpAliso]|nr:hypothetical protein RPALISO_230 [Ruegeria phage RpAliso]